MQKHLCELCGSNIDKNIDLCTSLNNLKVRKYLHDLCGSDIDKNRVLKEILSKNKNILKFYNFAILYLKL